MLKFHYITLLFLLNKLNAGGGCSKSVNPVASTNENANNHYNRADNYFKESDKNNNYSAEKTVLDDNITYLKLLSKKMAENAELNKVYEKNLLEQGPINYINSNTSNNLNDVLRSNNSVNSSSKQNYLVSGKNTFNASTALSERDVKSVSCHRIDSKNAEYAYNPLIPLSEKSLSIRTEAPNLEIASLLGRGNISSENNKNKTKNSKTANIPVDQQNSQGNVESGSHISAIQTQIEKQEANNQFNREETTGYNSPCYNLLVLVDSFGNSINQTSNADKYVLHRIDNFTWNSDRDRSTSTSFNPLPEFVNADELSSQYSNSFYNSIDV